MHFIEIMPNAQLVKIEEKPELSHVMEQTSCSPNLYDFYKLENEEFNEITEDLDTSLVTELITILKEAELALPPPDKISGSSFEGSYTLHKNALNKTIQHQDKNEIIDLILNGRKWQTNETINILSHEDSIKLHEVLTDYPVEDLQINYNWASYQSVSSWQEQVKNEMTWLFESINYTATHDASLLYFYC